MAFWKKVIKESEVEEEEPVLEQKHVIPAPKKKEEPKRPYWVYKTTDGKWATTTDPEEAKELAKITLVIKYR